MLNIHSLTAFIFFLSAVALFAGCVNLTKFGTPYKAGRTAVLIYKGASNRLSEKERQQIQTVYEKFVIADSPYKVFEELVKLCSDKPELTFLCEIVYNEIKPHLEMPESVAEFRKGMIDAVAEYY